MEATLQRSQSSAGTESLYTLSRGETVETVPSPRSSSNLYGRSSSDEASVGGTGELEGGRGSHGDGTSPETPGSPSSAGSSSSQPTEDSTSAGSGASSGSGATADKSGSAVQTSAAPAATPAPATAPPPLPPPAQRVDPQRIFVTKLSQRTTPEVLRRYLVNFLVRTVPGRRTREVEACITDVYMPVNDHAAPGVYRHRGIAFVTVQDAVCVRVLTNRSVVHEVDGRRIVIDLAAPKGTNVRVLAGAGESAPEGAAGGEAGEVDDEERGLLPTSARIRPSWPGAPVFTVAGGNGGFSAVVQDGGDRDSATVAAALAAAAEQEPPAPRPRGPRREPDHSGYSEGHEHGAGGRSRGHGGRGSGGHGYARSSGGGGSGIYSSPYATSPNPRPGPANYAPDYYGGPVYGYGEGPIPLPYGAERGGPGVAYALVPLPPGAGLPPGAYMAPSWAGAGPLPPGYFVEAGGPALHPGRGGWVEGGRYPPAHSSAAAPSPPPPSSSSHTTNHHHQPHQQAQQQPPSHGPNSPRSSDGAYESAPPSGPYWGGHHPQQSPPPSRHYGAGPAEGGASGGAGPSYPGWSGASGGSGAAAATDPSGSYYGSARPQPAAGGYGHPSVMGAPHPADMLYPPRHPLASIPLPPLDMSHATSGSLHAYQSALHSHLQGSGWPPALVMLTPPGSARSGATTPLPSPVHGGAAAHDMGAGAGSGGGGASGNARLGAKRPPPLGEASQAGGLDMDGGVAGVSDGSTSSNIRHIAAVLDPSPMPPTPFIHFTPTGPQLFGMHGGGGKA